MATESFIGGDVFIPEGESRDEQKAFGSVAETSVVLSPKEPFQR